MDVARLFEIAARLNLPGLLLQGAEFIAAVRDGAAQVEGVLTDADWAQIEAIHARALAANEALDAALAEAEQR